MKAAVLIVLSGLASPAAFGADAGGRPFLAPLDLLKQGAVHFDCHEVAPGDKAGGVMVFQFDLTLGSPSRPPNWPGVAPKNEVTLAKVQLGSRAGGPAGLEPAHWWDVSKEIFDNSGGSILFAGTPYERLEFSADYDGAPLGGHVGPEWSERLDVQQDLETKLVFVHYETTHIVDHGEACRADWQNCEPRSRVIENETFLCGPTITAHISQ